MTPDALLLSILVILAVASAFISAVETALFSIQPSQLDALRESQSRFATTLVGMLENPRRLLSSILLADAVVNAPLLVGSLALIESHQRLDLPPWALALILLALLVFICDLVPKLIALSAPKQVARLGVPVFHKLTPLLDPVARLLQTFAERVAEAILPAALKKQRHLSEDEIDTLVGMLGSSLSPLESEVLGSFMSGKSYEAIAEQAGCDPKAVDNAMQRVKRKIETHRAQRDDVAAIG